MNARNAPNNVTIRRAKPTDDAHRVARYLFSSAPDVLAYSLAPQRDEPTTFMVLAAGFVANDGAFSHKRVIVAEREGTLVGAVACFPAKDKNAIFARTARPVLKALPARDWPTLAMRGVRIAPFGDGIPEDSLYLSQIGVDPSARSQGIGSLLLDAVFAHAKSLGLARVSLHVSIDNPRAEALYARHGFRAMGVVGERSLSEKEGIPMQRVMVAERLE